MVEILTGGPPDQRRPVQRWLLVLGALVVVSVLVVSVLGHESGARGSDGTAPATSLPLDTAPATGPVLTCPVETGTAAPDGATRPLVGLLIVGGTPMGALDRWDTTADDGAWSVVLRGTDGSLARHSAVLTFPADGAGGRSVRVNNVLGRATEGEVSWPIGGARARVRGDLGEVALVKIAAATDVVRGRPVLHPPEGYTVVSSGPYRPPHMREVRYDGSRLGVGLEGLVTSGVSAGAGLEDLMFTGSLTPCGAVGGHPAVVTTAFGGNGALVWQTAPGQVAYLGYSGSALTGPVLGAVLQLAGRLQSLDAQQWKASRPQTVIQRNDPG